MTLRVRLAFWYGALLAIVLAVSLSLAYLVHATTLGRDMDGALRGSWQHDAVDPELTSLVPGSLNAPDSVIGPTAIWLMPEAGGTPVESAGDVNDPGLAGIAPDRIGDAYAWVSTPVGRVRTYGGSVTGTGYRLVVATSAAGLDASMAELRWILLAMIIAGVLIAVGGGWAISGHALRPIATLTQTAREIALSRGFAHRVSVPAGEKDELGELARTFNSMLTSLDDAYRRQQRLVGDVSHELRTPLSTIQGNAEILVRHYLDEAERRIAGGLVLRESARLARLVDDLLVLARADAGPQPFAPRPVQLDEVLMEAFSELRPQAGPRLRVSGIEAVVVQGERDRLTQLVLVLVDNALRYTPGDGEVLLSLGAESADAVLRVADAGIGLAPDDAAHAFERFFRSDAARRLDPGGVGLGLPIAKWIVERHGGTISLAPRSPVGTLATVRLPVAVS